MEAILKKKVVFDKEAQTELTNLGFISEIAKGHQSPRDPDPVCP